MSNLLMDFNTEWDVLPGIQFTCMVEPKKTNYMSELDMYDYSWSFLSTFKQLSTETEREVSTVESGEHFTWVLIKHLQKLYTLCDVDYFEDCVDYLKYKNGVFKSALHIMSLSLPPELVHDDLEFEEYFISEQMELSIDDCLTIIEHLKDWGYDYNQNDLYT